MKLALGFAVAVGLMLLVVILGDQLVGLSPATPSMSTRDRLDHLRVVVAAVGVVATVNFIVIWLTFRHPPSDDSPPLGHE